MKIARFFWSRRYLLFLVLVVLISYGHLLQMYPWQDDHTIFFKLAHLSEKAGYFGYGPIGQGSYKYIITPYVLIYKLFGFNIPVYFFFDLLFYFLASFFVYKVLSKILGETSGRVGGFLYASGYIAADGFLRIFNSIATSSSVILISLLTYCYWNFYKSKKIKYYLFSIIFYFLSVELFRIRTHYLLAAIVSFELIFLMFREFPRSIFKSFLRLLPFFYIFYNYFILNADSRSSEVKDLVVGLLHGKFYLLYGWISSIGHLSIPDWLTGIFNNQLRIGYLLVFVIIFFFVYRSFRNIKNRTLSILFLLLTTVWYFVSKNIFSVPFLNLGSSDFFIAFLGGVVILLSPFILKGLVKFRDRQRLFLFFLVWALVNIAAYSAYSPTVSYGSIQRYLAHSFFAVTSLFAVIFSVLKDKKGLFSKLGIFLILIWGTGNLVNSFNYQKDVVQTRSNIEKKFYTQLHSYLPVINKGDILYFDVADDARQNFADCFSVASMPEETAIAWQYGLDRYDFRRITDFKELISLVKTGSFGDVNDKAVKIGKIYSFFYSRDGLVNTTTELNKLLKGTSLELADVHNLNIPAYTPTLLRLNIKASYLNNQQFPYVSNVNFVSNTVSLDPNLRSMAFKYKSFKTQFLNSVKVTSSSDWRENVVGNVIDNNTDTVWQPDRILWHDGKQYLQIDLGRLEEISQFVWTNAYANNSPTHYFVDVSKDGKSWKNVSEVNSVQRIESGSIQVVRFDSQTVRFVRFRIASSLNDDSPGVSEVWVVPSEFSILDVGETERFLSNPFGFVPDSGSFVNTLKFLNYKGNAHVFWRSDKSAEWKTDFNSTVSLIYDGRNRDYLVTLSTAGTKITDIKIDNLEIPGDIKINSIEWRKLSLY